MPDRKRMVAFAIGVGDAKPLPYLGGAVNSARQFHEWASRLGYSSRLVVDADPNTPVTIKRLEDEFLAELQIPTPPIYRLVIYFAGHGLIREAEEGLWLLSDWHDRLRAVAVEQLRRRLYRFGVGQIAIFSDSCRSLPPNIDAADLASDPVLGVGPNPKNDPPIDKFIAAQDGSATFMVPGDTPENDRCLFSGVLMEGLWGLKLGAFSKIDKDKVTSRSLGAFLKDEVPKRAAQYKRVLSPSISPTFPEGEDIYFEHGGLITPPSIPPWPSTPISPTGEPNAPLRPSAQRISPRISIDKANLLDRFDYVYGTEGARLKAPSELTSLTPKSRQRKLKNVGRLLLKRIRSQSRPERFETGSGFVVEGGKVRNLWTRADLFVESHGAANWWRIGHQSSYQLISSTPVLIEFEDGTFGAVTALPRFIATVLRDQRGLAALIYRQIDTPMEATAAAEMAVAQLESGTLRADAVTDLAAEIRQWKHSDPVLGAISAYLYDSIGDVESIRRMAYFYVLNHQPIPYDIALLAHLRGERYDNGLLSVLVPAVAARKPRTNKEKRHDWTHSATETVTGEVGGFWPWMRQGWALLDDPDDGSALIHSELAALIPNLTTGRFATLNAEGGRILAKIFGLSPRL